MRKAILTVTACAALLTTTATAQVTSLPINPCLSAKIKSVGKSLAVRVGCFSKEASSGDADASCHVKASDKFTGDTNPSKGVFNKLDAKYPMASTTPCITFNDMGNLDSSLASYAATLPGVTGTVIGTTTSKCDAAKIKCVAKYVAALAKCNAKAAGKTGTIDTTCTGKAAAKLANGASGCLDKAALETSCSNAGSQAGALQGIADTLIQNAVCALSPPATAGCSCTGMADGMTCEAGIDAPQTKICVNQKCSTCTSSVGSPRFVSNGNGTVTDRQTCLVWEQKTTAVGSGVNLADPHDVDNGYTWSTGTNNPDGTIFTDFLETLNMGAGFAGHKDWRLPSEDGRIPPNTGTNELESILTGSFQCASNPCIDSAFGPTLSSLYWSATTESSAPYYAWFVYFDYGYVGYDGKTGHGAARAVRGGL